MNKYARIGRPCLIQAIGPQKNHTVTGLRDTGEVDRDRPCCFTCRHYKDMHMESYSAMPEALKVRMDNICRNCPYCAYKKETVTLYVNEKNRYGYKERLGLVPTKVLVYCHFAGPDKNGVAKSIRITEIAKAAGCSRRSVLNAFDKLSEHGYILSGHCGRGMVNAMIPSYKEIGLPADKGGRGYITLNQDAFLKVMGCSDITQLRVMLRILLDTDTSKDGSTTEEIDTFRRFLPSYCKPGIIKKALENTGFQVSFRDAGTVKIQLDKQSCGRIRFQEEFRNALSEIRKHVSQICSEMDAANKKTVMHKSAGSEKRKLKKDGYTLEPNRNGMKFFVPFRFSDQDFRDLAHVAVAHSVDEVEKALVFVYSHYHALFKKYSPGAIVRSIIQHGQIAIGL